MRLDYIGSGSRGGWGDTQADEQSKKEDDLSGIRYRLPPLLSRSGMDGSNYQKDPIVTFVAIDYLLALVTV